MRTLYWAAPEVYLGAVDGSGDAPIPEGTFEMSTDKASALSKISLLSSRLVNPVVIELRVQDRQIINEGTPLGLQPFFAHRLDNGISTRLNGTSYWYQRLFEMMAAWPTTPEDVEKFRRELLTSIGASVVLDEEQGRAWALDLADLRYVRTHGYEERPTTINDHRHILH